ncbi:hypothetical protein SB6413_05366 [Klebsiella pasteurii]|nr:hypothetical protein SB6413_05366 [Klebsiella pasteurii]
MAADLNPPLGTTTPEIFMDNVKRADELVNGPAGTVDDRGGDLTEQRRTSADMTKIRNAGHFRQCLVERVFKPFFPGTGLLADHEADNLIFSELKIFTQQQIFNVAVAGAGEFD